MKFHVPIMLELRNNQPKAQPPDIFVETGTWKGGTTALALNFFADVHTIERSVVHHIGAWRTFWTYGHVHCHFGDSRVVLASLCELVLPPVPVFFYLDAHWFRVDHAVGKGEFPLWAEIEAIAARNVADVVVVDDVHSFGTENPEPAWKDVTLENIVKAFQNAGRVATGWEREGCDQVAVYLE